MADILQGGVVNGTLIPNASVNGVHSKSVNLSGKMQIPKTTAGPDIGIATTTEPGIIIVGENLKIDPRGVLSVDTANDVEQDNTKPITAAAVYTEIGNIDALLQTI